MRTLRAALDELGHDTFVLARPTDSGFDKPDFVAGDGVWDQPRVTIAPAADIEPAVYVEWAETNRLDAVFVFQNFDVDGLAALRSRGVATIGTYMWEGFGPPDAERVAPALDRIYAFNRPSAVRYRELGLEVGDPVPFALHPSFVPPSLPRREPGGVRFLFNAGYLRARKPLGVVVDAFVQGAPADATLTVKAQIPVRAGDLIRPTDSRQLARRYELHPGDLAALGEGDPRIRIVVDDLDEDAFVRQLLAHDVVVGVSRWEGLGLHLYECEALGIPLVLNRMEPYVDFARRGGRCRLVDSAVLGARKQGIDVHEPDLASLADAFAGLHSPEAVAERFGPPAPDPDRWPAFVAAVADLLPGSVR